jgi:putative CRISPR-associated protein (TIGR02619 family)
MSRILTTVGVSLRGNAARALVKPVDDLTVSDLREHLRRSEPTDACAETNSLARLDTAGAEIVLIHTNTPECQMCAEALIEHIDKTGEARAVRPREVELVGGEAHIVREGLRNFTNALGDEIEGARRERQEPIVVATGGFKVEIAYTTVVTMLYRIPCYYIHESARDLVKLPALPIEWDHNLIFTNRPFFEWIAEDLRPLADVEVRLRSVYDDEAVRGLLEFEEGLGRLSVAGQMLWDMYTAEPTVTELPPTNIPESDRVRLPSDEHHWPKRTKEVCASIAKLPFVEAITSLRFENTANSRVRYQPGRGIDALHSDGDKGVRLIVHTTAKTHAEERFAAQCIERILL